MQEETGTTEDAMAGWDHRPDGHESQWTPGVGDGQGGLACCDSWGHKEADTTERLNWTELKDMLTIMKLKTHKETINHEEEIADRQKRQISELLDKNY